MDQRDLSAWSSMISGHTKHGRPIRAFSLFSELLKNGVYPDNHIITGVLKACTVTASLRNGKQVHGHVLKACVDPDIYVFNSLIEMYMSCCAIDQGAQVFDEMLVKNTVSWNLMISGFSHNGFPFEAMEIFREMNFREMGPNPMTFTSIFPICTELRLLNQGREIHGCVLRSAFWSNTRIRNCLIDIYAKCERREKAQMVFDTMLREKDISSWNSIISCYSQSGHGDEALKLFREMKVQSLEPNVNTWTIIISQFAKDGKREKAWDAFNAMIKQGIEPDIRLYNTMISSFSNDPLQALTVLYKMKATDIRVNHFTIASVLPVCGRLGVLVRGKELHAHTLRHGFELDSHVVCALVHMYAQCGCWNFSLLVFCMAKHKDLALWNSMLGAYAMHGQGHLALDLFERMKREKVKIDGVTLTNVLCACSRSGLVREGLRVLESVERESGVRPKVEHYGCVVDMLGRNGKIREALEEAESHGVEAWGAVLGACRVYGELEIGEVVAQKLFEMEPRNSGNYVLLANMYAEVGRWSDVERVRRMMVDRDLTKVPGCSVIGVR
ncbi:pentatricopeptide repeat-containing protein At1g11290, chloroplastic [Amborella trichopoda]|uniref:pentatricopeptide repeat-containing protein At1g11290, chloroplastic n=1 Tax=Amborella trichopoda TaxID=13333 RepID=UPI0005D44B15|nr:pentatricopeptide repeat-containing protein At1g11290, chloroplastic [Amborella trichopoda]|eukprot:XP_011625981.1 pentatricopeptide repeat-containing protein At1g11290, chloroplastic [Amborella trichopoda]